MMNLGYAKFNAASHCKDEPPPGWVWLLAVHYVIKYNLEQNVQIMLHKLWSKKLKEQKVAMTMQRKRHQRAKDIY